MIHHDVVKVKVLDVKHEVPGAWGQYDAVPMQFWGGEIGCWGGDWSIKGLSISSHSESHFVRLFLLGKNVTDDAAIYDLGVLGDFVPADEEASVSYLYVPDSLENSSNFIWHALAIFEFFRALDEVSVFLCLSCLGEDDCIISPWL